MTHFHLLLVFKSISRKTFSNFLKNYYFIFRDKVDQDGLELTEVLLPVPPGWVRLEVCGISPSLELSYKDFLVPLLAFILPDWLLDKIMQLHFGMELLSSCGSA